MDLNIEEVKPYLSLLIGFEKLKSEHDSVHKTILKIIEETSNHDVTTSPTKKDDNNRNMEIYYTPYLIEKSPSWYAGSEIKDIDYNIFISFKHKKYYAFLLTENNKKDNVRENFNTKILPEISPAPIETLNEKFIDEDNIKMLWLSDIGGNGNFKADLKVLGGNSVADTLDPLIDQSYMMSAVRTQSLNNAKTSVGINPSKSSIWRGPCGNWNSFCNRVFEILDSLNSESENKPGAISILSYPIPNTEDLRQPYDFSLFDYELFPEEDGQRKKDLLRSLYYNNYYADIAESFDDSDIALKITKDSEVVGYVTVKVLINDYRADFEIKHKNPIKKKEFEHYLKVFNHPEIIKCWFESGHAIVKGMIFKTGYQDVEYNGFIWADFEDYDLKKEKPGKLKEKPELHKIGSEKSLFCWVKNRWNGNWLERSKFNTTENPKGWLFCDDGAGETADFIHLTNHEGINIISLIHVKAAKSSSLNRRISVGAHDVVLSQGVKNLRHCMRKNLASDLRARIDSSGRKFCWLDGEQIESKQFIKKIESIKESEETKVRVIIVQPHTRKKFYLKSKSTNSKRQLDVLLVSAENAIRSSNAEFHIIGIED